MRTRRILWRIAIACALVLLLGILPFWRTVWVGRGGYSRDSAGWDWLAALSGLVAIFGLGIGAWARPRVSVPLLGAVAAAVAFAVAAYAAGSYWSAILNGMVTFDPRLTMRPSLAVLVFAALAAVGAGCAVVLATSWSIDDDVVSRITAGGIYSRLAIACAILLILAPMTPRTSWTYPGGMATHSAGWDWIAPLSGIVAIGGLALARSSRPSVFLAVPGSILAALAFGISTAASTGHWYSLATGALDLDGASTTYPAPMVLPFAVIAAVGVVCSLVLLNLRNRFGEAR